MGIQILSMYLPQFHRVKENDEWWGDGFTDWVSVKTAKVLYEGHYEPHIPLHNNYYDLMNKSVMQWQAELMHEYGVDGQCFYHYWFKDAKKILEKPAENLLQWTDIDMPFCFCWANETWAQSWSKIRKANVWLDNESGNKKSGSGILLQQGYGDEKDWAIHFDYLLPFFKDRRYIKKGDMPILVIYRSCEIYCLEEMIDFFNERARKNGFSGVYFICANSDESLPDNADAVLIHEPQNVFRNVDITLDKTGIRLLDYADCCEKSFDSIIKRSKTYFEGFVGYDDTPRRGIKGISLSKTSPELFGKYLRRLLARSEQNGNEFVFINAWNEWGEGMHLEPDERYGYSFLEALKSAKEGYCITDYENNKKSNYQPCSVEESVKYKKYLGTLDFWMRLREHHLSLDKYFKEKRYMRIAIYGYGVFAKHLIEELKDTQIQVAEVIDQKKNRIICELDIVSPEETDISVDAIIVTSFYYFKEIKEFYKNKEIVVLSIEHIIREVCNEYGI